MNPEDWKAATEAFNTLLRIFAPAIGTWCVYLLKQITKELRELTETQRTLTTWQMNHDKRDDDRFDSLKREIDHYRTRLGLSRSYHEETQ